MLYNNIDQTLYFIKIVFLMNMSDSIVSLTYQEVEEIIEH